MPTVLQMEATECGAACLSMVLAHYGAWVDLDDVRTRCAVSRDGANARSIAEAARSYGLTAQGFSISLGRLAHQPFPIIAHWGFTHFVVIEGVSSSGVFVNDPASGRGTVPWAEVDERFTGVVLHLAPGDGFRRSGHRPSITRALVSRLAGTRGALITLILSGLLLVAPIVVAPMALDAFVQQYVYAGAVVWGPVCLAIIAVCVAMIAWISAVQAVVARRFVQSVSSAQSWSVMRHALRLPMSFFLQRSPGDISARVASLDQVARVVASTIVPSVIGVVVVVAVSITLMLYSWPLACIALIALACALAALRLGRRTLSDQAGRANQTGTRFISSLTYALHSIETIQATSQQDATMSRLLDDAAEQSQARALVQRTASLLGMLPTLVTLVGSALIVGIGGILLEAQDITVGGYIAVIALVPLLFRPLVTWVAAVESIQQVGSALNRLDDLQRVPLPHRSDAVPSPESVLEMSQVCFRYGLLDEDAVHDLSLRVTPGSSVALVGLSGSGKSTAARIAVGLLTPTSGAAVVGGVATCDLRDDVRGRVIGYLAQDSALFAGTVRQNVSMFDDEADSDSVSDALRQAGLLDEILERPRGLDADVVEGGANLSGGQRQRLEMARALYAQPRILVLDEATSALDPIVELRILTELATMGAGLLIIAHRLSTVRDCDEIIVLDGGRVVERGTHDDLLRHAGRYAQLVAMA